MNHFTLSLGLLIFVGLIANADDLPAVQMNGEFYKFSDAVKLKGGRLSRVKNGYSITTQRQEHFTVYKNGTGLSAARSSFFPESILVNFIFKGTIGLATAFINDRGPIFSIEIDKYGNGQGAVYLETSKDGQNIELRKKTQSLRGKFSIGKESRIECTGREKLVCNNL